MFIAQSINELPTQNRILDAPVKKAALFGIVIGSGTRLAGSVTFSLKNLAFCTLRNKILLTACDRFCESVRLPRRFRDCQCCPPIHDE